MRTRTRNLAALALAAAAALGTSPPVGNPGWDKLKTLVGEWKGTYAGADEGAAGMGDVRLSYKLVSNGTSLMETMESGHDTSMITMYFPEGNRILATHYCSIGNQPRLASAGLTGTGKILRFSLVDATNASGLDAELMQGLVVTFQDPDHFTQAWTSRLKGKDQVGTFTYTRVSQKPGTR
jgi:hypothetical protein